MINIKLDNIKVGDVFKNYKELCKALDERIKGGDGKKYQLIDWERYFTYEKQGYKFIIIEIHNNPLDKKDGRKIGNNVLPFIDEMELLLINLLLNSEDKELTISNSKLLLMLSMINPNYLTYVNDKEQLSKLVDVNINFIIDFYDVTNSTFRSAINTVTKRLENKKLVIHEQVTMVCFVDTPVKKTLTGHNKIIEMYTYDNNSNSYTYKNVLPKEIYREATSDERELIVRLEKHIMKNKYGYDNIQDLFLAGKATSFYADVSRVLFKELNIKKAYKAHRYTFNIDNLNDEMIKLLDKYDINELKRQINNKVMIRLDETNNKRYIDALSELFDTDTNKVRVNVRADDNYVDSMNHLSSNLIDKDNKDGIKNSNNEILNETEIDLLQY
ncbi:hypothetical protein GAG94_03500 [Lysinibacillus sphaericus]|nr:hypothetical protein GAG94_03500 [Lysinibacillus sphaericus]